MTGTRENEVGLPSVASLPAWMALLISLLSLASAPPAMAGDVVDVRDRGAVPDDGNRDDTAFEKAIDALPSSGGTILVRDGTYVLGGQGASRRNLIDIQRSQVRLDIGSASRLIYGENFFADPGDTGHMIRIGREGNSVSNVVVDGNGGATLDGDTDNQASVVGRGNAAQIGVFGNADSVTLKNFTGINSPGTFFWVAGHGDIPYGQSSHPEDRVEDLTIANVSIRNSGEGINFFTSRRTRIEDTEWINMTQQDALEPNGGSTDWRIENVIVRRTAQSCANPFTTTIPLEDGVIEDFVFEECAVQGEGGIALGGSEPIRNVTIKNGVIRKVSPRDGDFNAKAVQLETNTFNSLVKNVRVDSSPQGINLAGRKHKVIGGRVRHSFYGVWVRNSADSSLVRGFRAENTNEGIRVYGDHNLIEGNQIDTGPGRGMQIRGSLNRVRNNRISDRDSSGIALRKDADANQIQGNHVFSNTADGIRNWDADAERNVFRWNILHDNGVPNAFAGAGIFLQKAPHNRVIENVAWNNEAGAFRTDLADSPTVRGNQTLAEHDFPGLISGHTLRLKPTDLTQKPSDPSRGRYFFHNGKNGAPAGLYRAYPTEKQYVRVGDLTGTISY